MIMNYKVFGCAIILSLGFTACSRKMNISSVFADAEKQTQVMLQEIPKAKGNNAELVSPRTLVSGDLKLVTSRDWTSGFFPGVLWFLNEYTGRNDWKAQAGNYTAN